MNKLVIPLLACIACAVIVSVTAVSVRYEQNLNKENEKKVKILAAAGIVTDKVTATFGSQAMPYGNAWGLHRPSQNAFISVPRLHMVGTGVGLSTSVYGVGIQTFYGNDEYWAGRLSYSLWDQTIGLSVDGEEALLLDVSSKASVLGFPIVTSAEYDLSEEGDGWFWIRSVVTPTFAKGASILVGFNSDDEILMMNYYMGLGLSVLINVFFLLNYQQKVINLSESVIHFNINQI